MLNNKCNTEINIQEAITNNNIEAISDILFVLSRYFKKYQKHYDEVIGDEEMSKKFRNCKKEMMNTMKTINQIKTTDPYFCKKTNGLNIGETAKIQNQHNDNDYESGLRIGHSYFIEKGRFKNKILKVMNFDKDKNVIMNNGFYLDDCVIKRVE